PPPRPPTLFPYTTLFRSAPDSGTTLSSSGGVVRTGPPGGAPIDAHATTEAAASATTHRTASALCREAAAGGRSTRRVSCVRPRRSEEHTSELQSPYDLVC